MDSILKVPSFTNKEIAKRAFGLIFSPGWILQRAVRMLHFGIEDDLESLVPYDCINSSPDGTFLLRELRGTSGARGSGRSKPKPDVGISLEDCLGRHGNYIDSLP